MSMNKKLLFLSFAFLLLASSGAEAQVFSWAYNKVRSILMDTASVEKARIIAYPTIAYSPETRWEFGVSTLMVYHAAKDTSNRLSELNLFTFFTLERQYGLWLDHALYSDKNQWFFLGKMRWQSFPLRYYGLGPDTPENYPAIVEGNYFLLRERILHRIYKSFYGGLEFDIQHLGSAGFVSTPNGNPYTLPRGAEGGTNLGIGLGIVYDSRYNVLNVREGFFAEIAHLRYNFWGRHENIFQSNTIDLRYHLPTVRNQVLAFQLFGIQNTGDVPFNLAAEMGGETIMRGYYRGRYRDNVLLAAQAEYRWLPFSFSKRFGAAVFFSAGNVGHTIGSLWETRWKPAGGAGLRFLLFPKKDVFTRLDFAVTRESNGIYFFIGESF